MPLTHRKLAQSVTFAPGHALDDESLDPGLRRETDEALALTGKDVGTPIIHFRPPDGVAFFGPVISRLPSDADAARLWDHVIGLAGFPGFAELKRSLRERPSWPASACRPTRPARRKTGTAAAAASRSNSRAPERRRHHAHRPARVERLPRQRPPLGTCRRHLPGRERWPGRPLSRAGSAPLRSRLPHPHRLQPARKPVPHERTRRSGRTAPQAPRTSGRHDHPPSGQ